MSLQMKEEKQAPTDHFILSTLENEAVYYPSHNECSDNRVIKEEPGNNDFDDSEYEVGFQDEYNETEQTPDNYHTNTSQTESKKLRTRTTAEQVERLIEFARNHSDLNKDSQLDPGEILRRRDNAWNILTAELNAMGPPSRTNLQWRRAWSVYKFNEKRRSVASNKAGRKRIRYSADQTDVPSSRLSSMDDPDDSTKGADIPNDQFHSIILEKMDSVLQQQTKHTDQLERLNTNLEKLIDILAEKFT